MVQKHGQTNKVIKFIALTHIRHPVEVKEITSVYLYHLIRYTNEHQDTLNVNLIYSTPSCYLKALHDANIDWPTKSDDYFPYASDPNCYWTGYFTSRPNSKRFERLGNQFLQVCKKLSATAITPEDSYDENLTRLRDEMGVMQVGGVNGTQV